jgi:hypothetical protein
VGTTSLNSICNYSQQSENGRLKQNVYKIAVVVNMVKVDVNSMQEVCRNNHEGLGCFFTVPIQADVISSDVILEHLFMA